MENNKGCILVKESEYQKLKSKDISIKIKNDYFGRYDNIGKTIVITLYGDIINLVSYNLLCQINRIKFLISESLENKFKNEILHIDSKIQEGFNLGYDNACKQIANMSYWERIKFLKQWKQK